MTRRHDLSSRTVPGDHLDELPQPGTDAFVFASPRRTLWGRGEALRIELPAPWPDHVGAVAEAVAAIDHTGLTGPGRGPVAFGALPYDRDAAATLVVPAILHARSSDGDRWSTRVAGGGEQVVVASTPRAAAQPSTVVIDAGDPDRWVRLVEDATHRIAEGSVTKVVLAREITVTGSGGFDAVALLRRLRQTSPASYAYSVDGFVGVTPELLVSRIGDVVRAHPMAGTTPRTGDPDADGRRAGELLRSTKNRAEHQITIDVVHETLLPWCSYLDAEPEPSVVAAGPVQHLATLVEGRLSRPEPTVLELVAALHPTPAVGGWPREAALALQSELEAVDRGRYAGPVGWVDASGNGVFGVGIRGVQLDGDAARLFAGVGVVAGSDPLAELEEARSKAQTVISALSRV